MAKQSSEADGSVPAVLLTRPAAASSRFADALAHRFGAGVDPIVSPLMQPVFQQPDLPDPPLFAVIFTSDAGVEGARRLQAAGAALPPRAFCVGDRTARAATDAGFRAISADGDAKDLLRLIQETKPTAPLLYLHGRDTRGDLAENLHAAGLVTFAVQVYQQDPLPLSPRALARLAEDCPVLLPLFSPRSADLLAAQLPATTAPLYIAAMSAAVASRAAQIPHCALRIAARPDAEAMLDALDDLRILAQMP